MTAAVIGIDTRLIGLPPRIVVRGGNDMIVLRQFGAYTDSIGIGPLFRLIIGC